MSARPGGGVRSAAVATCVAVAILLVSFHPQALSYPALNGVVHW